MGCVELFLFIQSFFIRSCWSGKRSAGAIRTGIFKFEFMTLHLAERLLRSRGSQCWGKPGHQPRLGDGV